MSCLGRDGSDRPTREVRGSRRSASRTSVHYKFAPESHIKRKRLTLRLGFHDTSDALEPRRYRHDLFLRLAPGIVQARQLIDRPESDLLLDDLQIVARSV